MISDDELFALIERKFGGIRQFATAIGMPKSTLNSILKKGISTASVANARKICKGLNLSLEEVAGPCEEYPFDYSEARRFYELYQNAPKLQTAINELLKYTPKK